MDVWPTDEIYEKIFDFSETEPYKDSYEILGYEHANFMGLIGSTPINILILLLSSIIIAILTKIALKHHKKAIVRSLASKYLAEFDLK